MGGEARGKALPLERDVGWGWRAGDSSPVAPCTSPTTGMVPGDPQTTLNAPPVRLLLRLCSLRGSRSSPEALTGFVRALFGQAGPWARFKLNFPKLDPFCCRFCAKTGGSTAPARAELRCSRSERNQAQDTAAPRKPSSLQQGRGSNYCWLINTPDPWEPLLRRAPTGGLCAGGSVPCPREQGLGAGTRLLLSVGTTGGSARGSPCRAVPNCAVLCQIVPCCAKLCRAVPNCAVPCPRRCPCTHHASQFGMVSSLVSRDALHARSRSSFLTGRRKGRNGRQRPGLLPPPRPR